MPRIFVSYRRKDDAASARHIAEIFEKNFGKESVFFDYHSMPAAVNFRGYITRKLEGSDLLVLVIGPAWLERDDGGHARLFNPEDFVRLEIETALKLGIRIVPVLVNEARLPRRAELPDSLMPFLDFNSARVDNGRDFQACVQRLADDLKRALATSIDRQFHLTTTSPAPTARPKGILIDRHYTYLLTTYCASGRRNDPAGAEYEDLFNVLTYCLLFFDELLVEQQYVSSIAWTMDEQESKAFARLFRNFSFDLIPMEAETRLLLAETIEADLTDKAYINAVTRYYEDRPLQGMNHRDLVTYIARCIFAAETQNWCLLPWKKRTPLFDYKLHHANRYVVADAVVGLVQGAVDIVVPELKCRSLAELDKLRSDPRVEDFRQKIWELSERFMSDADAEPAAALVLEEFRAANRQLLAGFNGTEKTIQIGQSGASPLPVSASINLPEDFERQLGERRFNWLLFLMGGVDEN